MTKLQKKLCLGLLVLALLTPLGILLPKKFNAKEAWGEWGADKLGKITGYIPEGLKKLTDLWKAPMPDYNFGVEEASMTFQVITYVVSGLLGIAVCAFVVLMVSRLITRHEK